MLRSYNIYLLHILTTMNIRQILIACGVLVAAASCNDTDQAAFTSLPEGIKFIDAIHIDSSVNPADDFYTYAGGNWMKNTEIPASESRWGSFNLLGEFNKNALKQICEEASANPGSKNSASQMVGDLFASGMDTAAIDAAGFTPIKEELAKIESLQSPEDLMNHLAYLTTQGMNPLFSFYVSVDEKNVTQYIGGLWQGGLGLPDRDYYLKNQYREKEIRKKYMMHINQMYNLTNKSTGEGALNLGKKVLDFETKLAQASMARVDMRDPYKTYNKMSVAALDTFKLPISWAAFFEKVNAPNQDSIVVGQPAFFTTLSEMIATASMEEWKNYLAWHTLSNYAPYLSQDFDQENFSFYGKVLSGQKEQKERWKRVLSVVDGAVGHQMGKMYTDKYFTESAKKRMKELVDNLQETFAERIENLDWMSADTKVKAQEKLSTFIKKIGYPDKWKSYDGLEIVRDSYVQNIKNSNVFDYNFMVSKLGKEIDKTEWGMTPPTVNAYYNPSYNEIVFPAGILQYPFFSMEADDAAIYGAIGGVIGHEMTHGFDDQGSQYAADGNLKNWWTEDDKTKFEAKTKMVKEQFDNLTFFGKNVNGALTLGENIADLGGVTIAYAAYKKTEEGKKNEKLDGFTGDQRFFLSWAQVWRQNIREEEAAQRLVTDPHSPGVHRCNGPLSNFEPFYKAFNVTEDNKMWKPETERAVIW